MNHETELFDRQTNLRAKLRNSIADLQWVAYRFCQVYRLNAPPKQTLDYIHRLNESEGFLPDELQQILNWRNRISQATPETANQLFYDCWRFIHSFDEKLNNHV